MTPDGKYVAVPIRDGDSVDIVDVVQQKIVKTLPIKEPHNALNTGSNRYIYVSSMGSHEIDLIDLEKMVFIAHIPAGGRPRPYTVSSDGKTMYVAVADLHGFVIVDIPGQKVIERVEIPAQHGRCESCSTKLPIRLLTDWHSPRWKRAVGLEPEGRRDVHLRRQGEEGNGTCEHGEGAELDCLHSDGKYACISNADTDDVSIIDAKTRSQVTRVKVGRVPKRLAVASAPMATGNPAEQDLMYFLMPVSDSSAIVNTGGPLEAIERDDRVGGSSCVRNRRFSAGKGTFETVAATPLPELHDGL